MRYGSASSQDPGRPRMLVLHKHAQTSAPFREHVYDIAFASNRRLLALHQTGVHLYLAISCSVYSRNSALHNDSHAGHRGQRLWKQA